VVEAARTGGALITAVKAAEYGIPVFAMPGDVDRAASEGTNRLIRDGAYPVFDPDDLVDELDLVDGRAGRLGRR
jgi:DNA processing protein